ncbi:Hermansky-Pudlak syndrome 1 protein [Protopterus annectens]|uniref:Hermansky-Pudlak syndrome 1 protein n=1 Tax=Protopterus annectens TaxID=7888 RepID=UPI001CFAA4EE|nr:Hermansky-Pudlak syndrome 1 protein [Protopterus annectens]
MKCLLIASESAEVLFYWTDPEFHHSVYEKFRFSTADDDQVPAFEDAVNTLFAPIIISCSNLIEKLGDTYTSFTSENNHLYILHQFGDCLYIAVNGDNEENEDDLRRKIYVLKRLIEIHFGLVTLDSAIMKRELRPSDTDRRRQIWKMFQSLLVTYSRLREFDQSFLVEAVERLIQPQICENCIELLERQVVQQVNASAEGAGEEIVHAFILVHTKLLAFYSSRNASLLKPSDLLTLILIAQDLYPYDCTAEEVTAQEVQSTSQPEVFYTPSSTPLGSSRAGASRREPKNSFVFTFTDPDIQVAEDSLQSLECSSTLPVIPRRIFLDTMLKEGFCPMMPHTMYCMSLWPGISLVLLTKIPSSTFALSMYQLLDIFSVLEKKLSEGTDQGHFSRSNPSLPELKQKMDKFTKMLGDRETQLQDAWLDFRNRIFSRSETSSSMEILQACRNMKHQLCVFYRQCFLCFPGGRIPHISQRLQDRVLKIVQDKLVDWKEFLLTKCKRNVTLVSYLEDFPGLVHFIYVDRTVGQMIAPSLNTVGKSPSELGQGPLARFIKNKVWSIIGLSRHYLQKGYTTLTLRDGDYYCCYFLWFENELGYKLEVMELPYLPSESAPIGMLAGDYYRKLLRYYAKSHPSEMVKCYELLTIHLGVIPTDSIIQQACELARKLWEPTRIPLL